MRKKAVTVVVVGFLLCVGLLSVGETKDINLGWSGQGSWSTLPYIVAGERGFFEKEGLKVRLITSVGRTSC